MSSKQDLINFVLALPGAAAWYGKDKLQGWVDGKIMSVTYDKWFTWWTAGHKDYVAAEVQRHTGQPDPLSGWKNVNVYKPVIDFLTKQLANQQAEYDKLSHSQNNPDNNPIALGVISDTIAMTRQALQYYKHLAGQA